MIILIGGSPRCGKTTLAKALAEATGIPHIPADYLGAVISPYIAADAFDELLPWAAISRVNRGNDVRYSGYSANQIVDFYLTQADTFWPGVKNFIDYALHEKQEFILEGYHFQPSLVRSLVTDANRDQIRSIFLYKTDEADILCGLQASDPEHDWALRDTREHATLRLIARMISRFGAQIEESARQFGGHAFHMDGDFQDRVAKAAAYLMDNRELLNKHELLSSEEPHES